MLSYTSGTRYRRVCYPLYCVSYGLGQTPMNLTLHTNHILLLIDIHTAASATRCIGLIDCQFSPPLVLMAVPQLQH